MEYTYGFYASSCSAVGFWKRDDEGKQSTFYVFAGARKDGARKKNIFCLVDNEDIGKDTLFGTEIDDVYSAYGSWYDGSDFDFDLEAQKKIHHCLTSQLRVKRIKSKKGIKGKLGTNGIGLEGKYEEETELEGDI